MEPRKTLVIMSFKGLEGYRDVLTLVQAALKVDRPRITKNLLGAWVYSRKVDFKEACTVVDIVNARKLDVTVYLDDKPIRTFSDVKAIFFGFPLEEVPE